MNQPNHQNEWNPPDEEQIDFRLLFYKYFLRFWYLYLLLPIIGFGLAKLYLRYQVPIYEVNAMLLITDEDRSASLSEEAIFADLGIEPDNRNIEDEMLIMKSRGLLEQVVNELGLMKSFYTEGRIITTESYPSSLLDIDTLLLSPTVDDRSYYLEILDQETFRLYDENGFDETYSFNEIIVNELGAMRFQYIGNGRQPSDQVRLIVRFDNAKKLAKSLSNEIKTKSIPNSNGIELSIRTPEIQKGKDILNTLITKYNENVIDNKNTVGENTLKFINDRIRELKAELDFAERGVESYKADRRIIGGDLSAFDNLYQEIKENEEIIRKLETQKSLLESLKAYVNNQNNQLQTIPVNLVASEMSLNESIVTYNDLIFQRQESLKAATEDNVLIETFDAKIRFERENIRKALIVTIQEYDKQIEKQQIEYDQVVSNLEGIPRQERELTEIIRQQSIKESLFLYLLQKREETELSVAVTTDNSQLLQSADQKGKPVSPNKKSILMLAIVAGLAIPAGIALLLDVLNDKATNEEDIKSRTQIPILGTINHSRKDTPMVIERGSRSAIAERFRLLRTNLQFMMPLESDNFCLLITSNASGEGKSFISMNLAASLALAGKKVVLIGLDLRKPKLKTYLGYTEETKGISNYLTGNADWQDVIYPTKYQNGVDFIPSGPIPPNPAELIMGDRMKDLIIALKQQYDYIVIDMSPIGVVTDAFLLTSFVDITLLTIRFKQTPKGVISRFEDLRQSEKFKQLGIIFNGVKSSRYGSYGYGYGYGYYKED